MRRALLTLLWCLSGLLIGGAPALAEEQPDAYKDVDLVVEVVHHAGLSRKVARMRPIGVIKG